MSSASQASIPAAAVLPVRLFLGVTFLYAGAQKISDPGFLRPGSQTYIGSQLLAFSRGSPIQFILLHLAEHAAAIGALTVLTELAIGVLVLLGLLTRPAAVIGLILNLIFFLSASWHTFPYFYGADIVFVVCWITLALTGPGPWALDILLRPRIHHMLRAQRASLGLSAVEMFLIGSSPLPHADVESTSQEPLAPTGREGSSYLLTRAEALIGMTATTVVIVLALVPRGRGSAQASGSLSAAGKTSSKGPPNTSSANNSGLPSAKKVGNVSQLPVNTAGTVTDPKTGDPAIIVHAADSHFYAYDAVCTHAGCTVEYDPQQRLLLCPCHGGAFDPEHGARVVAGPPPAPLNVIAMKIDASGNIYIV